MVMRILSSAFTDERGVCLLSRTGVSEATEALWEEYEAFQLSWKRAASAGFCTEGGFSAILVESTLS